MHSFFCTYPSFYSSVLSLFLLIFFSLNHLCVLVCLLTKLVLIPTLLHLKKKRFWPSDVLPSVHSWFKWGLGSSNSLSSDSTERFKREGRERRLTLLTSLNYLHILACHPDWFVGAHEGRGEWCCWNLAVGERRFNDKRGGKAQVTSRD